MKVSNVKSRIFVALSVLFYLSPNLSAAEIINLTGGWKGPITVCGDSPFPNRQFEAPHLVEFTNLEIGSEVLTNFSPKNTKVVIEPTIGYYEVIRIAKATHSDLGAELRLKRFQEGFGLSLDYAWHFPPRITLTYSYDSTGKAKDLTLFLSNQDQTGVLLKCKIYDSKP